MEVDALDYATGEVSFIECEDKKWRPVAFLLKFLNKTERNYKIYEKEMLAVIRRLYHIQVHPSGKYISMVILLSQKCPLYKPIFYSSHLTCNMPYSSDATIWIFHLL